MNESTLLIAFISFVTLLLVVSIIVRKMSVQDIFDNDSTSYTAQSLTLPMSKRIQLNSSKSPAREEKSFNLNRENIYKFGRALSIIGAIILFTPTPESIKAFGLGMASLGWILSKATAPPKKTGRSPQKNATAQKVRMLAGKPEYNKALKLLYTDINDASLVSEEEKYRRAISYLQTKKVSKSEAKDNLRLLLALLTQKQK